MGYHETAKDKKFQYSRDVHVDMEFAHSTKEEELKVSNSYTKLQKDFQEHADNEDRIIDLHFRMFGNILVKYEKHQEQHVKKEFKYYDYEHEFIEKLQNQKDTYESDMIKDSFTEEEKYPSDSHQRRFERLNQLMDDKLENDSEYTDGFDEDEPTIEFYAGETEFKRSILDHQKRDLDSLYSSSLKNSFSGSETSGPIDIGLLRSRSHFETLPSVGHDVEDIDYLSASFDALKSQRNTLKIGYLKKENESEVKMKRLIHLLAEMAISCCYPGSTSSDYPLSIQFKNSGSQISIDHTSCELVVDFLNLISTKTPSLEIHQMNFAHLPEIKDFNYKVFQKNET